jgi:hypothetical protein
MQTPLVEELLLVSVTLYSNWLGMPFPLFLLFPPLPKLCNKTFASLLLLHHMKILFSDAFKTMNTISN